MLSRYFSSGVGTGDSANSIVETKLGLVGFLGRQPCEVDRAGSIIVVEPFPVPHINLLRRDKRVDVGNLHPIGRAKSLPLRQSVCWPNDNNGSLRSLCILHYPLT